MEDGLWMMKGNRKHVRNRTVMALIRVGQPGKLTIGSVDLLRK
jgi:hypothetical protein